jgi:hypothetical protein
MKNLYRMLAVLAAVTVLLAPSAIWASQTPAPPPTAQQPDSAKTSSLRGELVKVDTDAMTLVIRAADGNEHTFGYTDRTEVTGAQEGVAGLSTKAGSRVTVHYEGEGNVRTATKIEVEAAQ